MGEDQAATALARNALRDVAELDRFTAARRQLTDHPANLVEGFADLFDAGLLIVAEVYHLLMLHAENIIVKDMERKIKRCVETAQRNLSDDAAIAAIRRLGYDPLVALQTIACLVEAHLQAKNLAPSTFGREALGASDFVFRLRRGRRCSFPLVARVLEHIHASP